MKKYIIFFTTIIMFFLLPAKTFSIDYRGHWAEENINDAIKNGYAAGMEDGTFEPDRNIKRSEFIVLLINYLGVEADSLFTTFNDISPDAWYFNYIAVAEEKNIIKGFDDGGFHPDSFVTRQDAVSFICRAYNINPPTEQFFSSFTDYSDISDYAKNYFCFAIKNNLISGYGNNTLKPKNNITRAESLIILSKFSEISDSFENVPKFVSGYPKLSPNGKMGNVTLELKTNLPCNIYYKVFKGNSPITPSPQEITDFLASPSLEYQTITSILSLDSEDAEYTIYFLPVSENGTLGKIESLKHIKALAYSKGNGTIENPYIIYDEKQLDYIRYCQDKHFRLANDIYLSKEWVPIDASDGFFGTLDGNGHTIYNLKISNSNQNVGFFSIIKNGIIKNLTISGNVNAKNNVGLFAGKSENSSIINCVALGEVISSSNNGGGFVGVNNGNINNSLSALFSIHANVNAGGFAGTNTGNITNSLSAVTSVTSSIYSGALSGLNIGGCIKNCLSANLTVNNELSYNSGILTTNKENGVTLNNYSFKDAIVNVSNSISDPDSNNGISVTWNDITDINFYKNYLNWNFITSWNFQDFSEKNFILPVPKVFDDISVNLGTTPYAPVKISTIEEFYNIKPYFHYILINDLYCKSNTYFTPIISDFKGSFDGKGFKISGLNIPYSENYTSYTIFGNIMPGASVRNVTFQDISITGKDTIASICDSNYGIIENCKVSGKYISTFPNSKLSAGGISSINCSIIENCDVKIDFKINSSSTTIGGISSHNEGIINNCSYSGMISLSQNTNSSVSLGGIAGFNNEGYIYNSVSDINFDIKSNIIYAGGICGILNSGEIFKTSSKGNIKILSSDTIYNGGICGMSVSGLIVNSFSSAKQNTASPTSYSGGIVGYNTSANIQETYSINTITQNSTSTAPVLYAGGIAGFNESGFISSNVSINPWILSIGNVKRIANCDNDEFLMNNYSYSEMLKDLKADKSQQNGFPVSIKELYNLNFFFKPIYSGGKLGWSSDAYNDSDAIWTTSSSGNNVYKFPVLKDVKLQSGYILPEEFQ